MGSAEGLYCDAVGNGAMHHVDELAGIADSMGFHLIARTEKRAFSIGLAVPCNLAELHDSRRSVMGISRQAQSPMVTGRGPLRERDEPIVVGGAGCGRLTREHNP